MPVQEAVMSVAEFFAYSNEERAKWRKWLEAHPEAVETRAQNDGGLRTVRLLLIHIFVAESWHAQRLEGLEPAIPQSIEEERNLTAIFDFGERERARLQRFAAETDEDLAVPREFGQSGRYRMSHRKTLFFLLLHETRHLAQVAMALRNGGYEPPGKHDLFFSGAME